MSATTLVLGLCGDGGGTGGVLSGGLSGSQIWSPCVCGGITSMLDVSSELSVALSGRLLLLLVSSE